MSKDSSATYIHFHHPRLADVFEDFNRPNTSQHAANQANDSSFGSGSNNPNSAMNININPNSSTGNTNNNNNGNNNPSNIPSFLPIEDIFVQAQYQPVNPEDEDDVVPDQHAAFGITRAMDSRREIAWRDLGLEELMSGVRLGVGGEKVGGKAAVGGVGGNGGGRRKKVVCLR